MSARWARKVAYLLDVPGPVAYNKKNDFLLQKWKEAKLLIKTKCDHTTHKHTLHTHAHETRTYKTNKTR